MEINLTTIIFAISIAAIIYIVLIRMYSKTSDAISMSDIHDDGRYFLRCGIVVRFKSYYRKFDAMSYYYAGDYTSMPEREYRNLFDIVGHSIDMLSYNKDGTHKSDKRLDIVKQI